MEWKTFLSVIFIIFVVVLLVFYWIIPVGSIVEFYFPGPTHSNFTLNESFGENMQFYENMRYQSPNISYKIEDCPLAREDEMKRSFEWIENLTILNFYEASEEEISITCKDTVIRGERGAFIAGEGGVTNVTLTENFNVIFNGKVILIRESNCPDPIVGTHELLHALGFDHSENQNNIMYPTVNCKQTIGEDIIDKINYLYSFPVLPDLSIENVSASMHGRYLEMVLSIRNHGLKKSEDSKIIIYSDNKQIKEFEIDEIGIGRGMEISFTHAFVLQTRIDEIKVYIEANFEELNKDNNQVILKIKEN